MTADENGAVSEARVRCPWSVPGNPLYTPYHDREWGVPVRDGRHLFEMLNLEGAQAGLSWRTILQKRPRYRTVFCGFDPRALSAWTDADVAQALQDPGIVRNRRKVEAVVGNARALMTHFGGDLQQFADFVWAPVGGQPVQHSCRSTAEVPVRDPNSDALASGLRRLGFKFVGSTICYAFMQAVGMVNDHLVTCFRYEEVRRLG